MLRHAGFINVASLPTQHRMYYGFSQLHCVELFLRHRVDISTIRISTADLDFLTTRLLPDQGQPGPLVFRPIPLSRADGCPSVMVTESPTSTKVKVLDMTARHSSEFTFAAVIKSKFGSMHRLYIH